MAKKITMFEVFTALMVASRYAGLKLDKIYLKLKNYKR